MCLSDFSVTNAQTHHTANNVILRRKTRRSENGRTSRGGNVIENKRFFCNDLNMLIPLILNAHIETTKDTSLHLP